MKGAKILMDETKQKIIDIINNIDDEIILTYLLVFITEYLKE